tara:strand:- start:1342 stop:2352 length:1011 start_codon:yes stop_codon:yes gene_type:complete
MIKSDIVVGMSYGDEGKGKITNHLLKENTYDRCVRFNGGCNAGHTIYENDQVVITHHVPAGILHGVKSVIGPGCVIDPDKFIQEMDMLTAAGFDVYGNVFIAQNAHVILDKHKEVDGIETRIGTTRSGNGPAYSAKYARTGVRAEHVEKLKDFMIDYYSDLDYLRSVGGKVLFEGAQGFGLDIDYGEYPYVTSSHCTSAGAMLNGISWKEVNRVYGVSKCYDTYVGAKSFQDQNDSMLGEFQRIGKEFGATTGRKRQCNYLDLDLLARAVASNGVTDIIFNKLDILQETNTWKVIRNKTLMNCYNEREFKSFVESVVWKIDRGVIISWSNNPETIW